MQTQKMSLIEKIKNQQKEMANEDIFILRKEIVIAVYEQISAMDPYLQKHRILTQQLEQYTDSQQQNQQTLGGGGFFSRKATTHVTLNSYQGTPTLSDAQGNRDSQQNPQRLSS
jgi:hypothetical protein